MLKDHNAVMPERLELAAPRFRVKHSNIEPLRSLELVYAIDSDHQLYNSLLILIEN